MIEDFVGNTIRIGEIIIIARDARGITPFRWGVVLDILPDRQEPLKILTLAPYPYKYGKAIPHKRFGFTAPDRVISQSPWQVPDIVILQLQTAFKKYKQKPILTGLNPPNPELSKMKEDVRDA